MGGYWRWVEAGLLVAAATSPWVLGLVLAFCSAREKTIVGDKSPYFRRRGVLEVLVFSCEMHWGAPKVVEFCNF